MKQKAQKINEFFHTNYARLRAICQSRWNGKGEDVLHEVYVCMMERNIRCLDEKYIWKTFHIFAKEIAARKYPEIMPYGEDMTYEECRTSRDRRKTRERIAKHIYTVCDEDGEQDQEKKKIHKHIAKLVEQHKKSQMCLFLVGVE